MSGLRGLVKYRCVLRYRQVGSGLSTMSGRDDTYSVGDGRTVGSEQLRGVGSISATLTISFTLQVEG